MKSSKIAISLGGIILIGIGVAMTLTNPGRKTYENYASKQLNTYIKENVCQEISTKGLGELLQRNCQVAIDTIRPQIKRLVAQNTQRQNFILFSIYRTQLSLPSPLPSYHFETLGIWGELHVYQAEKT